MNAAAVEVAAVSPRQERSVTVVMAAGELGGPEEEVRVALSQVPGPREQVAVEAQADTVTTSLVWGLHSPVRTVLSPAAVEVAAERARIPLEIPQKAAQEAMEEWW